MENRSHEEDQRLSADADTRRGSKLNQNYRYVIREHLEKFGKKIYKKLLFFCFANHRRESTAQLMGSVECAFNNAEETKRVRVQLLSELIELNPTLTALDEIKMTFMVQAMDNKLDGFPVQLPEKWSSLKDFAKTQ